MDKSIFTEKDNIPTNKELIDSLQTTYDLWIQILNYVHLKFPASTDEWNYPGEKYGWSFRIKDKKRAIIYLLPRNQFFIVAFVFGQKAYDAIMESSVSDFIKTELMAAKKYAEGRGIRIDINDEGIINDVKELIDIKLTY
ncbi:MAG: DUF3788 domain-containing protein [Bacteroidales bacterium]